MCIITHITIWYQRTQANVARIKLIWNSSLFHANSSHEKVTKSKTHEFYAQTSCDFDKVFMLISYNWNFARYSCEIVYLMCHYCFMQISCKYHVIFIQNSLQLYFLSKFENISCYILIRKLKSLSICFIQN